MVRRIVLEEDRPIYETWKLMALAVFRNDRKMFANSSLSADLMSANLPKNDKFRFDSHYIISAFEVFFNKALSYKTRLASREEGLKRVCQYSTY